MKISHLSAFHIRLAARALPLLMFGSLLTGCASHNPYAEKKGTAPSAYACYERYEPSLVQLARMRALRSYEDSPIDAAEKGYTVADIDVVNYTDHVKGVLRSKFTNARLARYTSSTAQVGLAAASGIAAAFSAGTTLVATLAFTSAAIPELGGIFNAKARASVYQDAVAKIESAEAGYYEKYPTPSITKFTPEARVLYANATANIEIVEKAIAGEVPDLKQVEKAEAVPGKEKKAADAPE